MKKRGVALIWAMVTGVVMLFIATIAANAIIKESHFSTNIDDSNAAYALANSGVAWAKECLANINDSNTHCLVGSKDYGPMLITTELSEVMSITEDSKKMSVAISYDGTNYAVNSTGTINPSSDNKVSRLLAYTQEANPLTPISKEEIVSVPDGKTVTVNGSFTLQFDFWLSISKTKDLYFGLGRDGRVTIDEPTEGIFIKYENATHLMSLIAKKAGITRGMGPNQKINIPEGLLIVPYAFQVEIKYIQDTSLILTLRNRDASGTPNPCSYRLSYDMTGVDLSGPYTLFSNGSPKGMILGRPDPASYGVGEDYIIVTNGSSNKEHFLDNIYQKGLTVIPGTTPPPPTPTTCTSFTGTKYPGPHGGSRVLFSYNCTGVTMDHVKIVYDDGDMSFDTATASQGEFDPGYWSSGMFADLYTCPTVSDDTCSPQLERVIIY